MTRGGFYSVDSLSGVHVLLVSDEAEGREVFGGVLTYCGALVTPAASAEEALAVMRRMKADVLIVELDIPGHDGYWLIQQVRALKPEDGGTTRAIGLRPPEDDGDGARAREVGYEVCLGLPLDPWVLCRAVSSLAATT
jgi:CheY-like chemotaxis protein